MQRDELFKELEAEWKKFFDQYETIKNILPSIIRWEWAGRPRYDSRPYFFQRGEKRGRLLKTAPEAKNGYTEYGFDEKGLLWLERYYWSKKTWDKFFIYTPDTYMELTFREYQDRRLLYKITKTIMKNGKMQSYASLETNYGYVDRTMAYPAPGQLDSYQGESLANADAESLWSRLIQQRYAVAWNYEEYSYQNKKLFQIQSYFHHSLTEPLLSETHFEYGAKSKPEKIRWKNQYGSQQLLYRQRKHGETLATIVSLAKKKLIETIPLAVRQANISEPIYCLNLYYFLANWGDYFPPDLLLGYERDRQRKLIEVPPEGAVHLKLYVSSGIWWYLWQFEEENTEIPYRLSIDEPETIEACENLEVEINSRHKSSLAVKALYEICQELNRLDWSKYVPITDDFIVYTCDQTEHTLPSTSLRRSGASDEQIKRWRKQGFL